MPLSIYVTHVHTYSTNLPPDRISDSANVPRSQSYINKGELHNYANSYFVNPKKLENVIGISIKYYIKKNSLISRLLYEMLCTCKNDF